MADESVVVNEYRTYKHPIVKTLSSWDAAHIVFKGETFALCGIAPVSGWDDTTDKNKPVCRHCIRLADTKCIREKLEF